MLLMANADRLLAILSLMGSLALPVFTIRWIAAAVILLATVAIQSLNNGTVRQ
jgi:hypothetical protein